MPKDNTCDFCRFYYVAVTDGMASAVCFNMSREKTGESIGPCFSCDYFEASLEARKVDAIEAMRDLFDLVVGESGDGYRVIYTMPFDT